MKDNSKMTKEQLITLLNKESLDNISKVRYLKKKAEVEEERIKESQQNLMSIRNELIKFQNKQIDINGHIRHLDNKLKYNYEGAK